MMSLTHATIATAETSLIFGTAYPLTLTLSILGFQLSNLNTTSAIGQIRYPISHLETKLTEAAANWEQLVRKLLELTGYEAATSGEMDTTGNSHAAVTGGSAALE